MVPKRITLFAGHYGSGKTNLALNYAAWIRRTTRARVILLDLDIVNPYFRSNDSATELASQGIELVVSDYANTNVDLPALPKETYAALADREAYLVFDVGGDDRGALALGRYVDEIRREGDYEMLAVVNFSRPLTETSEAALEILREIETVCALPFTALVNNTNLGNETTIETLRASAIKADELATKTGLPIRMTSVREDLADAASSVFDCIFPLTIQKLYYQIEKE